MVANRFLKAPFTIPYWATLSLLMNGVLFIALLVVWQEKDEGGEPTVLPQANAAYATNTAEPIASSEPASQGQRLTYEQWVTLICQEL